MMGFNIFDEFWQREHLEDIVDFVEPFEMTHPNHKYDDQFEDYKHGEKLLFNIPTIALCKNHLPFQHKLECNW